MAVSSLSVVALMAATSVSRKSSIVARAAAVASPAWIDVTTPARIAWGWEWTLPPVNASRSVFALMAATSVSRYPAMVVIVALSGAVYPDVASRLSMSAAIEAPEGAPSRAKASPVWGWTVPGIRASSVVVPEESAVGSAR
jgi:hypothetical protein